MVGPDQVRRWSWECWVDDVPAPAQEADHAALFFAKEDGMYVMANADIMAFHDAVDVYIAPSGE
jgi:hypothetical protein